MRFFVLFAAALVIAAPSFASDKTDAAAPIHQFIDSLNKGDVQSAGAVYAPDASILDDFPPHYWHGATAFADWNRDLTTSMQQGGGTDLVVKLGKPRHLDVTGDRAYAVFPSSLSYKVKGKTIHENGSTMTFALAKLADGWRIAAWCWAQH
ncbi:MAG TPA: nuclear transport factor 2 family protein [Rhizomicrobium sp.]|nr:nuclear transport factor 2 family protein [Rhizomicrobium sp.]